MNKQHNYLDLATIVHAQKNSAMELFINAIKKKKSAFISAALATLVLSIAGLATSIYSMQVYDRVIPNNGVSTLWVLTLGVALVIGFELFMKELRVRVVDHVTKEIDLELSDNFFTKAIDVRMD